MIPAGNTNYSLVGITPQINTEKKLGVKGNLNNIPTVEHRHRNCIDEDSGGDRTTCWENLDKKVMTQVVPWVPYLWSNNVAIVGPKVTHWNYDQFSDGTAYSQVSVK